MSKEIFKNVRIAKFRYIQHSRHRISYYSCVVCILCTRNIIVSAVDINSEIVTIVNTVLNNAANAKMLLC